jgi:hypothetical protein
VHVGLQEQLENLWAASLVGFELVMSRMAIHATTCKLAN